MAILESKLSGLGAALSAEAAEIADTVRTGVVVVASEQGRPRLGCSLARRWRSAHQQSCGGRWEGRNHPG